MLRAHCFTLSALDAFIRLSFALGNVVVLPDCPEMRASLPAVINSENFRNRDPHRASLRAVVAGGAGDGLILVQRHLRLRDHFRFSFAQGLEILHIAQVVLHLGDVAHPAQYREDPFLAGAEADRPAGVGAGTPGFIQDLPHLRNRISQRTALDRLHDDHRFSVRPADLKIPPACDTRVLPVCIVDLQLHEVHLGMGVQQFLQQIRIRVEGESDVSDQPLLLPLGNEFPEMEFVIILIVVPLQRVQQIVVEIPRAGSLQTGVKFLLCELLSGKEAADYYNDLYNNMQIRYGDMKKQMAADANVLLAPIRERILAYSSDDALLDRIMRDGAEKAAARAEKTIEEVREIIGFRKI